MAVSSTTNFDQIAVNPVMPYGGGELAGGKHNNQIEATMVVVDYSGRGWMVGRRGERVAGDPRGSGGGHHNERGGGDDA